jgi:hypothetical protein
MNFHMNGTEKPMVELHGMLKTSEDSIKKNLNHVMMVHKEKKRESIGRIPRAKVRKRFPMSSRTLILGQKASLALLLIKNASITTRRVIGSGTVRSI